MATVPEDSALNLQHMNVNPRGKQPKMRTTTNPLTGRLQPLVDDAGIPKGMRQVLRERCEHRRYAQNFGFSQ